MFISLSGIFLPTVMLSGFMFPVENMPLPLRIVSNIVPAKWYYSIVKSVMIKGLGIGADLERNTDTCRHDDVSSWYWQLRNLK